MKPARGVLLTEEAGDARSLSDLWNEARGLSGRERYRFVRPILASTARLLAEAHRKGFTHRDDHPGNILLQRRSDGSRRALFVDLLGARWRRRSVSKRRSCLALARLDHYVHGWATRAERLRFLRLYLQFREGTENVDAWSARIARAARRHAEAVARHRDRRLRRNEGYFTSLAPAEGWRARVVLRLARRRRFPEPDAPDRSAAEWKASLDRLIAELEAFPLPTDGEFTFAPNRSADIWRVEFRRARGFLTAVRWTLFGSPARREFERAHRRRHRDRPAALILACLEHRRRGFVDRTALVCPDRPRGAIGLRGSPGSATAEG
jgi:hypothetical protein